MPRPAPVALPPAPDHPLAPTPWDGWVPGRLDRATAPGLAVGRGWAMTFDRAVRPLIEAIAARAPYRRPRTARGNPMRLVSTSAGRLGSVADGGPFRYEPIDPHTGKPWPPMPPLFLEMATRAARAAGFDDFAPDTCLVNRYDPGASLGLHADREPHRPRSPVVSVSFGVSATFLWGGLRRDDPTVLVPLHHGDVLVWGGPDRLRFHGVMPVPSRLHPAWGSQRTSLTFRQVD